MTLIEIFSIIIIHWIADFVFQDEKWALGKSKNWKDLLSHTLTYTFAFYCLGFAIPYWLNGRTHIGLPTNNIQLLLFFPITLICHTITDYFTSRIVSKKFAKQEYGSTIPNFGAFTIIGIDQVLHYIQLFTTYYLLK
jgi:hypothetical protein